jgi:hypothetical protein
MPEETLFVGAGLAAVVTGFTTAAAVSAAFEWAAGMRVFTMAVAEASPLVAMLFMLGGNPAVTNLVAAATTAVLGAAIGSGDGEVGAGPGAVIAAAGATAAAAVATFFAWRNARPAADAQGALAPRVGT